MAEHVPCRAGGRHTDPRSSSLYPVKPSSQRRRSDPEADLGQSWAQNPAGEFPSHHGTTVHPRIGPVNKEHRSRDQRGTSWEPALVMEKEARGMGREGQGAPEEDTG